MKEVGHNADIIIFLQELPIFAPYWNNYDIPQWYLLILCRNYDELIRHKEKPIFDATHIQHFSPASSPCNNLLEEHKKKCQHALSKRKTKVSIVWTLDDITNAAKLLKKPPGKVRFSNEYEMRKVYSLIYDVFRCKYLTKNV